MAIFGSLADKLQETFKKLTGKGKLTEADIKVAMREVRLALLEADVSYKVVKDFVAKVTERAVGTEILESLSPGQQVIKIVNDELVALMGSENAKISMNSKPPTVVMMVGLQGTGKTTMLWQKLPTFSRKKAKDPFWLRATFTVPPPLSSCRFWENSWIFPFSALVIKSALLKLPNKPKNTP